MIIKELITKLENAELDEQLIQLYGNDSKEIERQRKRYIRAINSFKDLYPNREEVYIYSAPGRTEVCGNHTDHQHGCVLAAAVNLDAIAVVAFHEDGVIRLQSAGYEQEHIELNDLKVKSDEKGKTASLIRGTVAQFEELGVHVGGFDAYVTSDVLSGSGLSSSAAFEVLIGTIIDLHYNEGRAGAVKIAKMGQYTENLYFGKESGLMDQMVASVGGFVYIDFEDTTDPDIRKCECDFSKGKLRLFITDTKGSHADLTDDYVSVPSEMKLVAAQFGKNVLREVSEDEFYEKLPELRSICSDRAILRAVHFYKDHNRVKEEVKALEAGDFDVFLNLVRRSGRSSAELLQNLYSTKKPGEQGLPLALMMSERILGKKGGYRVHGGGFAGTIQAFVPDELAGEYQLAMEALFGKGCCYNLNIRPVGGTQVI